MRRRSIVLITSTLCKIKGSSRVLESPRKNHAAFFSPPPVSSRTVLVRHLDVHPEISVRFQIIDNHVGKMMHVDDHVVNAKRRAAAKA